MVIYAKYHDKHNVSIPQLGWGDFKRAWELTAETAWPVSIPQLGWGDFKPSIRSRESACFLGFQSLNWDGVISNHADAPERIPLTEVSIPQLGWGDFKLWLLHGLLLIGRAFQSLNWDGVISNRPPAPSKSWGRGFNPSIGMG